MKIKKITVFSVVCFVLIFLLVQTDKARYAVVEALNLCATAVIPTLFPFFVISGVLVNSGFVTVLGKVFAPASRVLFKTSGKGAVIFIIGVLCGYPTGAKVIAQMCKAKSLDKKDGERMLGFCNNSGPLFVIGAVGSAMLKSHSIGVMLYVIHLLSAVVTGVIFGMFKKYRRDENQTEIHIESLGDILTKSVEDSVKTILNVCGYVVFFALLCAMMENAFITSILEVTMGAKNIIALGLDEKSMLILLSGVIGFGGICVAFQVQSEVGSVGLSLKFYILGKMLQAIVSMLITFLYLNLFDAHFTFAPGISEYSVSYIPAFLFVFCAFVSLFGLTRKS